MKSVRYAVAGDITSLGVCEEPTPRPGRQEVLVRIHAASLNRAS